MSAPRLRVVQGPEPGSARCQWCDLPAIDEHYKITPDGYGTRQGKRVLVKMGKTVAVCRHHRERFEVQKREAEKRKEAEREARRKPR